MFMLSSQADDVLHEAEKYDPESVHTQFTMYKLALAQSDLEKGLILKYQIPKSVTYYITLNCQLKYM